MPVAEPVVFNPLDPAFRADPYSLYARMRQEDPVHQAPFGRWVLSRYADCVAILKDPRASSDLTNTEAYQQAIEKRGDAGPDDPLLKMRPFLIMTRPTTPGCAVW